MKIKNLWEQENKQRAEQKEKILDYEIAKSKTRSTTLFVSWFVHNDYYVRGNVLLLFCCCR